MNSATQNEELLNIARREVVIVQNYPAYNIAETKLGRVNFSHTDGVFTIAKLDGEVLFSGNEAETVIRLFEIYDAEMIFGGRA